MKLLFSLLLALLPLLAAAQSVPTTIPFAGLSLHLDAGGQRLVQQKVDALRSHPASFQARVVLADAYFPLIEKVFLQEGVPVDFRYLALQESGLQGEAQSIHDAVGYWQFKREAAADFGLLMNDQVDERKHIVASSRAAAQYLKRSNATFRNWLDVLLSYNLGIGGAKPYADAADANATGMDITARTHPYIITFLAHKLAYEPAVGRSASPTLALQEFPAQPGQPLSALAAAYHTTPDELTRYNHWLLASAVPADKAYTVLVPVTDATQLQALAARQPATSAATTAPSYQPDPRHPGFVLVNGVRALVAEPGDTPERLAERGQLPLRRFMRYNELFSFDNVVAGQPYFTQKKRDNAAVEYHVVRPEESLAAIARQYGVRAKSIQHKNRLARSEEPRPGRVLWMQHTRPRDVAVEYADAPALAAFAPPANSSAPAPATQPFPAPAGNVPVEAVMVEMEVAPTSPDTATSRTAPDTLATAAPTSAGAVYTAPRPAPTNANAAPRSDSAAATIATEEIVAAPGVVLRDPAAPRSASAPTSAVPIPTGPPAGARPATTPARASMAPTSPPSATAPAARTPAPTSATATPSPEAVPASGLHTVRAKETIYGVARLYHLSPRDLEAWNNLPLNAGLQIGQVLRVVPPVAATSAAPVVPAPTSPAPAKTPAASTGCSGRLGPNRAETYPAHRAGRRIDVWHFAQVRRHHQADSGVEQQVRLQREARRSFSHLSLIS